MMEGSTAAMEGSNGRLGREVWILRVIDSSTTTEGMVAMDDFTAKEGLMATDSNGGLKGNGNDGLDSGNGGA